MRIPTMTTEQAETQLGPRGHLLIDSDNRGTVRKWLVAQGYPAAFAATCTNRELSNAYNETDGTGLAVLNRKLKLANEFERRGRRCRSAAAWRQWESRRRVRPIAELGHVKRGAGRARGVADTAPASGTPRRAITHQRAP